jgi:NADPH:quinone reductase-like Zn-dependent oxidoreductase
MTLLDSRERYGAAGSVGSMVTQLAPEAGGYVIAGATTVRRRSTSA